MRAHSRSTIKIVKTKMIALRVTSPTTSGPFSVAIPVKRALPNPGRLKFFGEDGPAHQVGEVQA